MKMTCSFSMIKLSMGTYKKEFNSYMLQELKEAVGAWIQAAITIIPVWTGASHGTFMKLAAKIGQTFSISGTGGFPGMIGPEYGNRQSRGQLTVFDGAYTAEYSTTLWHLIYNESNDANAHPKEGRLYARLRDTGPYDFQTVANEAFQEYAQRVRMPSPWSYLTITTKQVS